VAADPLFDGVFVLRTNMKLSALAVVLRYRNLLAGGAKLFWQQRPCSRHTTGVPPHRCRNPRPHRGCTLATHRATIPEWQHIIGDLLDLSVVEVEQDGRRAILRTAAHLSGDADSPDIPKSSLTPVVPKNLMH
jgi:hypothetical protein